MKFNCFSRFRLNSALYLLALVLFSGCVLLCTGCSQSSNAPATEQTATEQPSTEPAAKPETEPETEVETELLTEEEPEAEEEFNWQNASVVFVGDSITAGTGTTKTYHSYLEEMGVFKSVKAMGRGGSCVSTQSDYGLEKYPLTERYTSIPEADLIVIFMGTNDYGHETPLGTISDTTDVSFYGALNVVVSGIQEKHPDSQIVFITPLHRYKFGKSEILGTSFTYDNLPNGNGHTLEDYVNAIKNIAEKYSLPVIDLFTLYPHTPENTDDRVRYFPDGLHPNTSGHRILAETIYEQLNLIPNETAR